MDEAELEKVGHLGLRRPEIVGEGGRFLEAVRALVLQSREHEAGVSGTTWLLKADAGGGLRPWTICGGGELGPGVAWVCVGRLRSCVPDCLLLAACLELEMHRQLLAPRRIDDAAWVYFKKGKGKLSERL